MSQGKSNGQIGRELSLSEDSGKTHARRLFRKLSASDRAQAAPPRCAPGDYIGPTVDAMRSSRISVRARRCVPKRWRMPSGPASQPW